MRNFAVKGNREIKWVENKGRWLNRRRLKFFNGSNNSMVEANGKDAIEGKKIMLEGQERRKLPKEEWRGWPQLRAGKVLP